MLLRRSNEAVRRLFCVAYVLGGLAAVCIAQNRPLPPPSESEAVQADTLVGAYYFPGWSQEDRWYCVKALDDVLHPLLGYYREGDPAVADWHIKWALEHGISFFAFDYYSFQGSEMLEEALQAMLRCRSIDQFRFCLNWCNHQEPETQDGEELRRFGDVVIDAYLKHPSYLRIDGRPVLMILGGYSFVKTLGVDGAAQAFSRLEERCREAGLPGLYLVSCEGFVDGAEAVSRGLEAGIDAFCLYNYPYAGSSVTGPGGEYAEMSYEHLIEQGRGLWEHWRGLTDGRFWPTAMPGWDRRPWTKDQDLRRVGSTAELFERSLSWAKDAVNADRVVMIEAWNEWGEGSVLEPSVEERFSYLEAVRRVFCPGVDRPESEAPAAEDRPEAPLPRVDRWGFSFGTDGWTPTRLGAFRQTTGCIEGVALDNDPAVSSPKTYLPCEEYTAIAVRLRAWADDASSADVETGEVFWSTTRGALSQSRSVSFQVPLDGEWHTHVISVADHAGWTGTLDGLRLDPVGRLGVHFQIDTVTVLP